jgi:hypothetical protein
VLVAIIDAPLAPFETIHDGFRRKERELLEVFARLTIIEAHTLRARLMNAWPDDALVARFGRLTIDRRTRIIEFLAGARRRQAIASTRR